MDCSSAGVLSMCLPALTSARSNNFASDVSNTGSPRLFTARRGNKSRSFARESSRSSWFNNTLDYHRRGLCDETKDAHSSTVSKIKVDSARGVEYHLLVFGEGMVLANGVLSGDPIQIKKTTIGLSEVIDGITFHTMMVYWVIAQRDGGFRRTEETEETVEDLFL